MPGYNLSQHDMYPYPLSCNTGAAKGEAVRVREGDWLTEAGALDRLHRKDGWFFFLCSVPSRFLRQPPRNACAAFGLTVVRTWELVHRLSPPFSLS